MTDALYLAELDGIRPGGLIEVSGPEGHHAAVVKRTLPGEWVLLADGAGRAIRGEVVAVTKQAIRVRVDEEVDVASGPHHWVTVQALAKNDRSDIAVQSLTELGVARIVAWQAARSVVRWDGTPGKADKGLAKWRATARESTKQSRRFTIPQVDYAATADVIALIEQAALAVVCHEDASLPMAGLELPPAGQIVMIIGPEGGISDEELAGFTAAGAQPVSLGEGVLRTSSAGLVALAQLQLLSALGQREG